jgi:hypothetical protein
MVSFFSFFNTAKRTLMFWLSALMRYSCGCTVCGAGPKIFQLLGLWRKQLQLACPDFIGIFIASIFIHCSKAKERSSTFSLVGFAASCERILLMSAIVIYFFFFIFLLSEFVSEIFFIALSKSLS